MKPSCECREDNGRGGTPRLARDFEPAIRFQIELGSESETAVNAYEQRMTF